MTDSSHYMLHYKLSEYISVTLSGLQGEKEYVLFDETISAQKPLEH